MKTNFDIKWHRLVGEENVGEPTHSEIQEVMKHIREQALRKCSLDRPVTATGRREVLKAVKKGIEEEGSGSCLFNPDGRPDFDIRKGYWESKLYVFPNESAALDWEDSR